MKILFRELNGLKRIGMREWSSKKGKQLCTDLARFAINSDQIKYKILYELMSSSLKQYMELIKPQTVVCSSINEILQKIL